MKRRSPSVLHQVLVTPSSPQQPDVVGPLGVELDYSAMTESDLPNSDPQETPTHHLPRLTTGITPIPLRLQETSPVQVLGDLYWNTLVVVPLRPSTYFCGLEGLCVVS